MSAKKLAALAVAALMLVALVQAASEDDPAPTAPEQTTTTEPTTSEEATKPTPLGCLEDAGLDRAEKRASDFWRGTDPNDGTLVRVSRFGSRREAATAVADASESTPRRAAATRCSVRSRTGRTMAPTCAWSQPAWRVADGAMTKTSTPGIYRRGTRYVVVWRHRGSQHKSFHGTLAEAREAKGGRQSGERTPTTRQSFEDYVPAWLDGYAGRLAPIGATPTNEVQARQLAPLRNDPEQAPRCVDGQLRAVMAEELANPGRGRQ